MKLQLKSSLLFFVIGITFLITISTIYYYQSHNLAVVNAQISSLEVTEEYAHRIEDHLEKDAHITSTLANSPIISQSLALSNSEFSRLNSEDREQKISRLNKKWMGIKDVNNPFIQSYMTNPVATYLKKQQKMFPDFYGEIFLTNSYGVIIATTKKLTTLAHAHKYWWVDAYYEGKGRIFFDDRGYDKSVKGYVLGVVVPVKKGDKIIGILKANIKILGPYSHLLNEFTEKKPGTMSLARSKGLIVFEKDSEPLSRKLSELLIEKMKNPVSNSLITTLDGTKQIISYAPVSVSKDSEHLAFGGKHTSIDHIKGSLGEGWFVILSRDVEEAVAASERLTKRILLIGLVFTLIIAATALLFGRRISQPIIKLIKMTKNIGQGDFKSEIEISSTDELGALAKSFNSMLARLRETTTSRDKLLEEISQRKRVEEDKEKLQNRVTSQSESLKQLDHEKSSAEQRLLLHRKQSPVGIIEWSTDFEALDWNPAAQRIFGYTKEEVLNRHVTETILPESSRQAVDKVWSDLLANKGGSHSINENTTKDGRTILCEWHNTPLVAHDGNVIGVTSLVDDITERQKNEESLRQSQKMNALGKLTGGIAHDFNNMLGVILGYSELLQIQLSDDPKLEKYVSEIYRAGERARKLTSKLLAFSRKEKTSIELSNINTVIQNERHLLEKTLTARIKVIFKPAESLWSVCLDKASLEDAILNMSINAQHAMPDGGTFTLDTQNAHLGIAEAQTMDIEPGDYVLLSLTDTGIGMDKTTQQQIFDPFFSTKGDMGTGLGMSQVYGFVKQSQGAIHLYSKPGQGTQITIYFPRCHETGVVDSVQQAVSSVELPAGNETILVVDDEVALRKLAEEILTTHGYRVLCADGGEQALDILETETVDLLLTDVIMPVMDGYQLATKVKKYYPQILIQIVSGFSEDYRVDLANEELHQQRLQKPINSDVLLQRIRNLLNEKAKQAQDIEVKASTEFESLSSIEWSDQYSTGIHEIDTDHKALMALANRCLDAINSSEPRKEIRLILDELLDYTKFHFQREECIMKVCGYPDLTKHQQLHQKLTNEVKEKVMKFGLGKLTAKSLLEFFVNWLTVHIKGEDKLIATCSKGKNDLIEQALVDSGLNNQSSDS